MDVMCTLFIYFGIFLNESIAMKFGYIEVPHFVYNYFLLLLFLLLLLLLLLSFMLWPWRLKESYSELRGVDYLKYITWGMDAPLQILLLLLLICYYFNYVVCNCFCWLGIKIINFDTFSEWKLEKFSLSLTTRLLMFSRKKLEGGCHRN